MQGAFIGHFIYLINIGGVVLLHYASFLKQARGTLAPELQVLPPILLAVAVADYAASLFVERSIRAGGPQRQSVAPIITAAFGVSIAVYGMVVWLLGASSGWFWLFVTIAALHWFHSALRWQNLQPRA